MAEGRKKRGEKGRKQGRKQGRNVVVLVLVVCITFEHAGEVVFDGRQKLIQIEHLSQAEVDSH